MSAVAERIRESTDKKLARLARAPAPNVVDLIGKAKKLGQLLKTKHLEAAVKVWLAGLEAEKDVYDKQSETWHREPDWKERRECANMIVAYMEGRPIERQVQISGGFEDLGQLIDRISASPIAQRKLGHLVDVSTKKT